MTPPASGEKETPTRYWFDTEFMEDGHTIELLSIGVVCEDGREFYAENRVADLTHANPWVRENVLPHLDRVRNGSIDGGTCWRPQDIAAQLVDFVGDGRSQPQFWAYYADYDWVVLCQLFGTMMDLPRGWPMFCMDNQQERVRLGVEALPEQGTTEHHALADARWNRQVWEFLSTYEHPPMAGASGSSEAGA